MINRYDAANNTRNDFIQAFWQLYAQKPLEKITVSELCRIAGYNRTTFYVYYNNLPDLLEKAVDSMLAPVRNHVDELKHVDAPLDTGLLERLYLEILKSNDAFIRILIQNHSLYILEDKVKDFMQPILRRVYGERALSEQELDYRLEYQVSAVFGVIGKWFREQNISDVELVHLLMAISHNGVMSASNGESLPEDPYGDLGLDRDVVESILQDIRQRQPL